MKLSIVIPTYNRHASLEGCLQSLVEQNYSSEFEVIVVNDGGSRIDECVEPFEALLNLRIIDRKNAGPGRARNVGAWQAQGPRVVFLDDDCKPAIDWLDRIESVSHDFPRALIGGQTVNLLSSNPFASASQLLIDFLYDFYSADGGRKGLFFTSNNFSVPREEFVAVGGFDTGFPTAAGEDREFCVRWRELGHSMHYNPSIIVGHAHQMGLRGFLRQHFNYGQAAREYWSIRSKRTGNKRKLESSSFYRQLLSYALKRHGFSYSGFNQSILIVLAQVANAVGYFSFSRSEQT